MYILEWPVYFNQNAISYMGTSDVDSSRSGRCGGENYLYVGDAYLLKKQNNTINKMYPMEHKTPSSPNK